MHRTWLLSSLLMACGGGDGSPGYAVVHGSLEVGEGEVSGYQVWEIFSTAWGKERSSEHHLCSSVMSFQGWPEESDGCIACEEVLELTMEPVETDCAEGYERFGEAVFYGFGEVARPFASEDPAPGLSRGWYVSWEEEQLEAVGFGVPEDADEAEDAEAAWVEGSRWKLSSGWVYDLSE